LAPRSTRPKWRSRREQVSAAMNMQVLALAFLATAAVGGIAWVFLYPLLSGERKAEGRRAHGQADREEPALAP
jgi:tight adherence protein B